VSSDSVVPHHDSVGLPLDTAVEILRICQMVVQELEEVVALLLFEANDVPCELWVDIQRLLASRWVSTDEWMDLVTDQRLVIKEKETRLTFETGALRTNVPLLSAAVACS
jgi:hypothetical protein